MNKCLLLSTLALLGYSAQAQVNPYDLNNVPESIKKGADVIKRLEDITFEVTDINRASKKVHSILTVKDEKGRRELNFREYTSKTVALDEATISVYDATGKMVKRYKKKDMNTVAYGDGLVDDGFVTYINVTPPSYPVTVEYEYEIKYKNTVVLPSFYILNPNEGVEKSNFTVRVPKDLDIRYKEKNIQLPPQVSEDGNYKIYKWSVANLSPVEDEEGAGAYDTRYPSIQLAPNRFSYYGSEGDLTSWKSYGEWMGKLYKGLDELPEDRKAFFQSLVKNAGSDRDKTRLIYDYLQKNFRYVSIQLGVGGFKPFSADFTDKKKYGDCKALSNYMKAALKSVGINSYVAIINAGYNGAPVDKDFPADNTLNHVILCVPQGKDSIWLECTSQTADFGVLSTFTENRNALLITETGGVLASTPSSRSTQNRLGITSVITLANDGSGQINTLFRTTGDSREFIDEVLGEKKDDQKESLVFGLGFKQPDEFEFLKKDSMGTVIPALTMEYEKVPEFTAGNKQFLAIRMYKFWSRKLPKAENRKLDYYFRSPEERIDTTIYKLSAGATVEALPKAKELSCAYATYTTKYWYNEAEKSVYTTASLVLKQHKIPAAHYAEVKKFFDDILMDDTQRIVVKKE